MVHMVFTIYETLLSQNIQDSIKAFTFDHTVVNTSHLSSTCILLEHLKKKKFYLPCRHYIFEIVFRSVFNEKISKLTGCDVSTFKIFQKEWKNINQNKFKSDIENKRIK